MKISGTASLAADPLKVWDAIHDPAVLARSLPGCDRLVEIGPNHYAMTVTAGVAAIKGSYDGEVRLLNPQHPESFTMKASGSGTPGTVAADVDVRVAPSEDGGTRVTYEADATVGGPIGGVGQRMLSGVTKKMAGQFFSAVDDDIAGVRKAVPAAAAPVEAAAPGVAVPAGAPVYAGAPAAPARAAVLDKGFAAGVGLGALIALIGVAVGAAIGRRR